MNKVPKNLQNDEISDWLEKSGLKRIHQGKVRDTYYLDDERLLVRATNRISIFDFVLPVLVDKKGEVLTALTHFWLTHALKGINFEHHLIYSESNSSPRANAAYDLDLSLSLPMLESCLVVKNMNTKLRPWEMIFRHFIGGSVYNKYLETGMAGGHKLTPNLPKWSKLGKPIFTPSTKEEVGNDVNVDFDYYFQEMEKAGHGKEAREAVGLLSQIYSTAYAYAEEKGILILDTKFEIAGLTIIDEVLTPDSSRFATKKDWEKAMAEGRDPNFHDKQPVRDWGTKIETPFEDKAGNQIKGINKLKPENPKHVAFVHSLSVPKEIVENTTDRYLYIFQILTGKSLEEYQATEMGV